MSVTTTRNQISSTVGVIRSRHNVIIHYDSYTQIELEQLIQDIGSARRNIRKGKMTLALDISPKRISLREASRSGPSDAMDIIRSRVVRKETSFEFADKQLESVQSLCEVAAHQVLRSGNCSTELENIQEKFKLVLETAESEVERRVEERKLKEGKVAEMPSHNSAKVVNKPVEIEIDDSSSGSTAWDDSIDISAVRLTRLW